MAADRLDDFELFYQEIPSAHDYLKESEIDDLVDNEPSSTAGLDADQVTLLAQDSLGFTEDTSTDTAPTTSSETIEQ